MHSTLVAICVASWSHFHLNVILLAKDCIISEHSSTFVQRKMYTGSVDGHRQQKSMAIIKPHIIRATQENK